MTSFRELKDLEKQIKAGGVIIRPEEAENRRRDEEAQKVQPHLDQLAARRQEANDLFEKLLVAAVTRDGYQGAAFADHLKAEADRIVGERQTAKWTQVASVLAELGVTQTGPAQRGMVWAAKLAGVELVPLSPPKPPAVIVPDPPKLGEATGVPRVEVPGDLLVVK